MASACEALPAPVVMRHGRFRVVRDDLLAGGTKMRYLLPLIAGSPERAFAYASPAQGYAQIALAHACTRLERQAVVFVAARAQPHGRTLAAKAAGAIVYQVRPGYLSVVRARAARYCADTGARLLPFGIDVPEAIEAFADAARAIEPAPAEVWACAGSGTLIRGLQRAWPQARFHAVQVGASPDVGAARLWRAPERYEQAARDPPPWPACDNYDAKVWQFARDAAADDALIWNVGA